MSAARDFQRLVGSEVAGLLGNDVQYVPSQLLFRWRGSDADNLVSLAGSNKWSPFISMAFYFGRRFHAVSRIEKAAGIRPDRWHISHYSVNRRLMKGMTYSGPYNWRVDITRPPASLGSEMAEAIRGMANPFFERFSSISVARDALEQVTAGA